MLLTIKVDGDENVLLNDIKTRLSKTDYQEITNEINKECDKCLINKAISLVSVYGSDWKDTKMQKVYYACGCDKNESKKIAGIIFKEVIINNKKYYFECVKVRGKNCYYKRKEK